MNRSGPPGFKRAGLALLVAAVLLAGGCAGTGVTTQVAPVSSPVSASAVSPLPGVDLDTRIQYYSIGGSTESEMRAQLSEKGPQGWDAYTSWYVRWKYDIVEAPGGYRVAAPRVSVEVVYTLPEWRAPSGAPPELAAKWSAYAAALRLHEDGHRDFGVTAANEVQRALQALPSSPSEDTLNLAAENAANAALEVQRSREGSYDATTSHGATQGARFP